MSKTTMKDIRMMAKVIGILPQFYSSVNLGSNKGVAQLVNNKTMIHPGDKNLFYDKKDGYFIQER